MYWIRLRWAGLDNWNELVCMDWVDGFNWFALEWIGWMKLDHLE